MTRLVPLLLRPARPDERVGLEALQRRASLAWDEYRDALLARPDAIDLPAAQILAGQVRVADCEGERVGLSVVLPRGDGQAELDGLFVDPERWRRGVGRALVDDAARRAHVGGAAWLHVVANPLALGFYEACGFEILGECATEFGPAVTMRRALGGMPRPG